MDIIDYDIIKSGSKVLVFLKVIDYPNEDGKGKLSYKTLSNIVYEMNDGYCVTDKKGVPLIIRDTLQLCEDFLREELESTHDVKKLLVLEPDET